MSMTEEQWEGLLSHLSGGLSVMSFCRAEMPEAPETIRSQIYERLRVDSGLANRYARAKELGIEARLDQARETAKSEPDVQRARLMIDLDKWEASKLLPKKYGDKLEHSGEVNVKLYGAFDPDQV